MATDLSDLISDLRNLADRCACASVNDSPDSVRQLQSYVKHIPSPDRFGVSVIASRDNFEARLELGCALDACMLLLGPNVGYMMSCNGAGLNFATIVLLENGAEHSCSASSGALALTGAMAIALSQCLEEQSRV